MFQQFFDFIFFILSGIKVGNRKTLYLDEKFFIIKNFIAQNWSKHNFCLLLLLILGRKTENFIYDTRNKKKTLIFSFSIELSVWEKEILLWKWKKSVVKKNVKNFQWMIYIKLYDITLYRTLANNLFTKSKCNNNQIKPRQRSFVLKLMSFPMKCDNCYEYFRNKSVLWWA